MDKLGPFLEVASLLGTWQVRTSEFLKGTKCAYAFTDGVILVSPALYSLMETEDLGRLFRNVDLKRLPFTSRFEPTLDFVSMEPWRKV